MIRFFIIFFIVFQVLGCEKKSIKGIKEAKKEIQIIVHNKGNKIEVPKNSPYFFEIIEICERSFKNSYDSLPIGIPSHIKRDYELVKKKKRKEFGIEIIYAEPKTIKTSIHGERRVERLFVPIEPSGVSYGTAGYMIFYKIDSSLSNWPKEWNIKKYGWGNYLTDRGVGKLNEILPKIGIKVPKSKRYFNKVEEKLVKIKIHNKGKEIKIDKKSEYFKDILNISEETTSKSFDNFPIIYDSLGFKESNYANLKEVEKIKISGVGVDIIYPKTKICETIEKDIGFYELFISFKKFYGYNQYAIIFTKIKYPQIGFFQKLLLKFYYHQSINKEEDIWKSYTAIYDLSKLEKVLQNFGIKISEEELDKGEIKMKIFKNGKEEEILSDNYKFLKIIKLVEEAFFDAHLIEEANEAENFKEMKKIKEGGEGIWVSYSNPRNFCRFIASKISEIFIPFRIFEGKDGKYFLLYAKYYDEYFRGYERINWLKFYNINKNKLDETKDELLKIGIKID